MPIHDCLNPLRQTASVFADRANRIVVKHHLGRIIAVIEAVSAGNKDSRAALREFVQKTVEFLRAGAHVLVVDLFPPTLRDPFGIHKAIWDEFVEEPFAFPDGKDRIVASYKAGAERVAYVEPLAIGENLPEMALFLSSEFHIPVPLEPTHRTAWEASPLGLRTAVEAGILPEPDAERYFGQPPAQRSLQLLTRVQDTRGRHVSESRDV